VILPHKDIRTKTWEILFLFTLVAKPELGLIQQNLDDYLGPMAGDYFPTSPIAARKSA